MPIANLVATATGFHNAWGLTGPSKVVAINDDDGLGGNFITDGGAGTRQTFVWTNLPLDARGGTIIQYEVEVTGRRAGGIAGASWNVRLRDLVTTSESNGPVHIATAAVPPDRFFDVITIDPNGVPWTQAQVDACDVGVIYNAGGTGINVFFEILHITFTGPSGSQDILGCAWLPPLIMAGLKGLNLFHESKEWYKIFDIMVLRKLMRQNDIRVFPAMMLREERESMLKELFTQRAYAF